MKDIKNRLTSRKLWMTIGGLVGLLLVGATGQMEWADVFDKLTILIVAYIGIEGGNDILKTIKK